MPRRAIFSPAAALATRRWPPPPKAVEPGLDLGQLLAGQVQGLLEQMALRYPSHPLFSQ